MFKTRTLFKPVFGAKAVVGLDIGTSSVKAVELKETSKGVELVRAGWRELEIDLEASSEERRERIIEAIKGLFAEHDIKADRVVMAVPGQSVIIRHLRLPPGTEDRVAQVIRYEATQQIPFPVDTVAMDWHVLGETSGGVDVILVAMKRELIEERIALVKAAGLRPVTVDVTSLALFNSLKFGIEGQGVEALINIGASTTDICIQRDGVLRFTRSAPIAGNDFTEAIQAKLHTDFGQAERLKREGAAQISEAVSPILGSLLAEIRRSIDYYQSQPEGAPVDRVMLSGGSARLRDLDKFLARELGLPVEIANPLEGIQVDSAQFDLQEISSSLAIPLGLALRGIGRAEIGISLLPAKVREEELARVRRRNLVLAGGLAAIIIFLSTALLFQRVRQDEPRIREIEAELAKFKKGTVAVVEKLKREKLALESRMTVVEGLITRRASWLDILSEMNKVIPSKIWLTSLSLEEDGKVTMGGKAFSRTAVADLMVSLKGSPYFGGISAPTTTTTKGSRVVDFTLDCMLVSTEPVVVSAASTKGKEPKRTILDELREHKEELEEI